VDARARPDEPGVPGNFTGPVMKRHWPVAVALGVYWAVTAALVRESIHLNDGHLVYPLDDAYIHMAIAKNAVLHGVWGVTPYQFTSATSSPLWTSLLGAVDAIAGVRHGTPLLLNLLAGTAVVLTGYTLMSARQGPAWRVLAALIVLIFVAPLPTLTVIGMEHTAHTLVTIWLVFAAATLLAVEAPPSARRLGALAALAAAGTALRYEGLFVAAAVGLLFAATKRWRAAMAVLAGAACPAIMYGAWSEAHGWFALPSSLLLKGRIPELRVKSLVDFAVGAPAFRNLLDTPAALMLVIGALAILLLLATAAPAWGKDHYLLALLAGATFLHMQFATTSRFYRYEAYLVTLGLAIFGALTSAGSGLVHLRRRGWDWRRRVIAIALAAVAGFPLASRAVNAVRNAPKASANIYRQQYQMGLFLDRFYQGRTVAVNDIGAVSYLADIRIFDVYGLASLEVASLKQRREYTASALAMLADRQRTDIAIVYPSWLSDFGGVPASWRHVGDWAVRDNVILGGTAVSFYAVRAGAHEQLVDNLRRFAPDLPLDISQSGEYRLAGNSR
jgi:hypothetical protein